MLLRKSNKLICFYLFLTPFFQKTKKYKEQIQVAVETTRWQVQDALEELLLLFSSKNSYYLLIITLKK